jgi:hypothetical protein
MGYFSLYDRPAEPYRSEPAREEDWGRYGARLRVRVAPVELDAVSSVQVGTVRLEP